MHVPGGTKAGKISKPYGLRGDLNIILNLSGGKSIEPNDPLFIDIDGQRVPFFVEEIDLISDDLAIIKFEFINNVEEARAVCGCEIFLDQKQAPDIKGDPNNPGSVVNYKAFDQRNELLGPVTGYMHNENNPVLIVDYRGKELIVPAVDEIIKGIDHKNRTIQFNLPEGLTEL